MTPSRFRGGGTDTDIYFAIGQCSLGSILAAQSKKGVCSILIGDDPDVLIHDVEKHIGIIANQNRTKSFFALRGEDRAQ